MEVPQTEKIIYYVYAFWHCLPNKDIVTKDNKKNIMEFENIDDAVAYIKKKCVNNVNITYCITYDKYEIDKIKGE